MHFPLLQLPHTWVHGNTLQDGNTAPFFNLPGVHHCWIVLSLLYVSFNWSVFYLRVPGWRISMLLITQTSWMWTKSRFGFWFVLQQGDEIMGRSLITIISRSLRRRTSNWWPGISLPLCSHPVYLIMARRKDVGIIINQYIITNNSFEASHWCCFHGEFLTSKPTFDSPDVVGVMQRHHVL